MTPWSLGIPAGTLSGLEKFEAPDPADWVPRGYAIVNVDSRGAFDSGGVRSWARRRPRTGTTRSKPWPQCRGARARWGSRATRISRSRSGSSPRCGRRRSRPSRRGTALYREQFARGGIYAGDLFDRLIVQHMLKGRGGLESFREMFKERPLANAWWNDKRPDMKRINVPTYITGTWTNTMHGMGAIRAWMEVESEDKWLRWHPWQEWYDLWGNEKAKEELFAFFDCFLKGEENGWKGTPKCRMALLRFGNKVPQAIEDIVEEEFPPKRTEYREMFFGAEGKLLAEAPSESTSVGYASADGESIGFTFTFTETTRVMGLPKAVLFMSCPDHDDMDVYVMIQKLDKDGTQMKNLNIPWKGIPIKSFEEFKPEEETEVVLYKGPVGILRASHRAIDESKSMHPHWPYHPHEKEEKITPGEVVRLDIGIWALGVEFEAGEGVRVVVSGKSFAVNNFGLDHTLNRGRHVVHLGGEYASRVVLPFV
uniref:X-pro dipeptidyl-peptidase c-terminal non-catalytic domain-containing protein n=1 Tax=Colletotrichum fructicola (strain Nara gc5) TaxID=1213859 RepID=L2FYX2_COLFN